jgi:hypothetical protein
VAKWSRASTTLAPGSTHASIDVCSGAYLSLQPAAAASAEAPEACATAVAAAGMAMLCRGLGCCVPKLPGLTTEAGQPYVWHTSNRCLFEHVICRCLHMFACNACVNVSPRTVVAMKE